VLRDGEPYIGVGAPGGSRIYTAIPQTIVNAVDHDMDMRTAVTVPRFHSEERQIIFMEPQFRENTIAALREWAMRFAAVRTCRVYRPFLLGPTRAIWKQVLTPAVAQVWVAGLPLPGVPVANEVLSV